MEVFVVSGGVNGEDCAKGILRGKSRRVMMTVFIPHIPLQHFSTTSRFQTARRPVIRMLQGFWVSWPSLSEIVGCQTQRSESTFKYLCEEACSQEISMY